MRNTCISLLIFTIFMLSGTTGKEVSASWKQKSGKFSNVDLGFQPSTDFARVLSVSYKRGVNATDETPENDFTPVRKFDGGDSEDLSNEEQNAAILKLYSNARPFNEEEYSGGQTSDRSPKSSRVHHGLANSSPHARQHYSEDAHTHGKFHFPDSINEISSDPHSHLLKQYDDSPYHHPRHQAYQSQAPKQLEAYHFPTTSYGVLQHQAQESALTEAVTKSLKFWIPTALLLTGASVLFPQRVKVPTNPSDAQSRPKRSTRHYSFTAGDVELFERILPQSVRQTTLAQSANHKDIQHSSFAFHNSHATSSSSILSRLPNESHSQYIQSATIHTSAKRPEYSAAQKSKPERHSHSPETAESQYNSTNFQKEVSNKKKPESVVTSSTHGSMTSATQSLQDKDNGTGRKFRVVARARKNSTSVIPGKQHGQLVARPKLKSDVKSSRTKAGDQSSRDSLSAGTTNTKSIPMQTTVIQKTAAAILSQNPGGIGPGTASAAATLSQNPGGIAPGTVATKLPQNPSEIAPRSVAATLSQIPSGMAPGSKTFNPIRLNFSEYQSDSLQRLGQRISVAVPTTLASNTDPKLTVKSYNLSLDGTMVGLPSSIVERKAESEVCQKRALCELAIRGVNPDATRFETFLWTLATLVPDAFTTFYTLEDTFAAIRAKECTRFDCPNPNLNIQEIPEFKN